MPRHNKFSLASKGKRLGKYGLKAVSRLGKFGLQTAVGALKNVAKEQAAKLVAETAASALV